MARQPLVRPVLVNVEVSRSHSDTTHCTTPLDEWSARCRHLYLTTHDTHKRLTSMSPAEFEPTIPASAWLQTHALDCTTTRIGLSLYWLRYEYLIPIPTWCTVKQTALTIGVEHRGMTAGGCRSSTYTGPLSMVSTLYSITRNIFACDLSYTLWKVIGDSLLGPVSCRANTQRPSYDNRPLL